MIPPSSAIAIENGGDLATLGRPHPDPQKKKQDRKK